MKQPCTKTLKTSSSNFRTSRALCAALLIQQASTSDLLALPPAKSKASPAVTPSKWHQAHLKSFHESRLFKSCRICGSHHCKYLVTFSSRSLAVATWFLQLSVLPITLNGRRDMNQELDKQASEHQAGGSAGSSHSKLLNLFIPDWIWTGVGGHVAATWRESCYLCFG